MKITQFKCARCGKVTSGRQPRRGDGSLVYPRRHRIAGKLCEGSFEEAQWVTVNGSINHLTGQTKMAPGKNLREFEPGPWSAYADRHHPCRVKS